MLDRAAGILLHAPERQWRLSMGIKSELRRFTRALRTDVAATRAQACMWVPRISVVTPSYNQGSFLEEAILSVLNQGYPNTEYIIMDGGSTDSSVEVIRKYERHLAYWVSERDEGQADALVKGFRRATGDILCYINSDDVFLPGAFRRVLRRFETSPSCAVVYGNGYMIDTRTRIVREDRFVPYLQIGLLRGGMGFCQPSVFWRGNAYREVGGINGGLQFCIDLDLLARFHRHGFRFGHVPRVLSAYRVHPATKSSNLLSVWERESRSICRSYLERTPRVLQWAFVNAARCYKIIYWVFTGSAVWLARRVRSYLADRPGSRSAFRYRRAEWRGTP